MNFWTLQRSSEYYIEKLAEIDCKGPIKLLLYVLVLVLFCLIFEKNMKFFRQTETITW